MASGKTVELQEFDRMQMWRSLRDREQYARDRSLSGKARRKARKDANKKELASE